MSCCCCGGGGGSGAASPRGDLLSGDLSGLALLLAGVDGVDGMEACRSDGWTDGRLPDLWMWHSSGKYCEVGLLLLM